MRARIDDPPRGDLAGWPRTVSYWCQRGHLTRPAWSANATPPELWECRHCGLPAGRDKSRPPQPKPVRRDMTPLAYLLERRSEAELDALLEETLDRLRARRQPRWATEPATAASRTCGELWNPRS
ncbi:RNA polymerase-binding protein RbpA [Pseudonocardia sp. Cha107L01]|uniref:RNA polymerase-binding protein RbpA n=1 Tax=Pseudonocardia sp. Cha107L01 TaxID=3457576 RepID=UPI00403ECDB8